jgi:hypothetical protein
MTAIERTAYPRFTRAPSVKELRDIYTPTPGDGAFVATKARGSSQKFALMIAARRSISVCITSQSHKPFLER